MTKSERKVLKDAGVGLRHFNEDVAWANGVLKGNPNDETRVGLLRCFYHLALARASLGATRKTIKALTFTRKTSRGSRA